MKATRRRAPGGVTILHTAIFSDVMHRNFNRRHTRKCIAIMLGFLADQTALKSREEQDFETTGVCRREMNGGYSRTTLRMFRTLVKPQHYVKLLADQVYAPSYPNPDFPQSRVSGN